MKNNLTVFLLAFFCPSLVTASIIHIPGDQPTIQAGIDAASNGDTVQVADGTYTGIGNRDLDFHGKAVTVQSENGPGLCLIDCENTGRGFRFHSGEGNSSIVDGFTIKNGYTDYNGGGMLCDGSAPTIQNCMFINSVAGDDGGGLYSNNGSAPVVTNCLFAGNQAADKAGGMYMRINDQSQVTNCTFSGNAAGSYGGGIFMWSNSEPTLANCVLWGNTAGIDGDEIGMDTGCTLTIVYSDVEGGEAGIYLYGSNTVVWGTGMIESDPLFVTGVWGVYYLSQSLAGQGSDSSCVDGGDPLSGMITGTTRTDAYQDSDTVDMGWHYPIGMIIQVPGDQPTIQAGIDAASDGSIVLVADGIYTGAGNRDIDFNGKAIIVRSENGPENCVIDCEGSELDPHRGFYFHSGEENTSILRGFTIQGGYQDGPVAADELGGGIYCINASPTILNNIITGNTAGGGGGIWTDDQSSPAITNCTISYNTAAGSGGGIYLHGSGSTTVMNCTITNNVADPPYSTGGGGGIGSSCENLYIIDSTITNNTAVQTYGGGVFSAFESQVEIIDSTISDNNARWGGGLHSQYCLSFLMTNCMISNNSADTGGAIYAYDATNVIISDCTVSGNTATSGSGGAIWYDADNLFISNCAILNNSAGDDGGGLYYLPYNSTGALEIRNCTLAGNAANNNGGGLYIIPQSIYKCSGTIINTILWDNNAVSGPEIWQDFSVVLNIHYSNIKGGSDSVHVEYGSLLNLGTGMMDSDPLFAIPGDYHLSNSSPCIDSGDPDYVPEAVETDLDGEDRVQHYRIDMGADETSAFRDCNANGIPDTLDVINGTSRDCNDNGFPDLCEVGPSMLAEPGHTPGFQTGQASSDRCIPTPRDLNGNCILDECEWASDQPSIETNIWYVDDDAPGDPGPGNPSISDPNEDGSAAHPFDAIQEAIDASRDGEHVVMLDGTYTGPGNRNITIINKNLYLYSLNGPDSCIIDAGGAQRIFFLNNILFGNTVYLEGLTLMNGYAPDSGGGIYSFDTDITVTNCRILDNFAAEDGGGIYVYDGILKISNSAIEGNTAGESGGGLCLYLCDSRTAVNYCTFTNNVASAGGGGIYLYASFSPQLSYNTISGNSADHGGGICASAKLISNHNIVADNTCTYDGGGILCSGYQGFTITYTTIRGNTASGDGGGIVCKKGTPGSNRDYKIINSMILGNHADGDGGGIYQSNEGSPDVTFSEISNCTISDNSAGDEGGGLFYDRFDADVVNTILWNNTGITGPEIWFGNLYGSDFPTMTINYCDVDGGIDSTYKYRSYLQWGVGMIDSDPLFVSPGNDDYHLLVGSPCINTGDPDFQPDPGETDIDGDPRVLDGRVDMGADEFSD